MDSEEEYKSELNKPKIRIKSLNQLLGNKKIITVPEIMIGNKLKLKFSFQQSKIKKSIIKPKFFSQTHSEKKQHPLINNKIYQKNKNQTSINFRSWNSQSQFSNQIIKRNTISHFRSRSVQLQNNSTKAIWRPINDIKKSVEQVKQSKITQKSVEIYQQNNHNRKMQFLKKGSNINKRVVVNLLKSKLGQKIKGQSQNGDDTIKNFQILRMIKIYKGYDQAPITIDPNQTIQMKRNSNDQQSFHEELEIKTFPFHNTNIELSVSQWNRKRLMQLQHERFKMPSDISEQFQN